MRTVTAPGGWLFQCRAGSEADLAAELVAAYGGYCRAVAGEAFLHWQPGDWQAPVAVDVLPVFSRQGWAVHEVFGPLDSADRLAGLLPLLDNTRAVAEIRLEHADTNEGRALQRFLKGFRRVLEKTLKARALLRPEAAAVLHLFFTDSCHGYLGYSGRGELPWENGVPRLRLSPQAPSRSALKIEEAWLRMMSPQEREHWLRAGATAADLGAAPGGWTWQLAKLGFKVWAVDHGQLDKTLMDEYPVSHVAADAFTWRPPRSLDWVVCDIVDKPARTLPLMIKWLDQGWARAALFNLKLPMKKRHAEVSRLLGRLSAQLPAYQLRAAQLYHDRDEVTVLVLPS